MENRQGKRERNALRTLRAIMRLAEEDLLATSDEEILEEAREDGVSPEDIERLRAGALEMVRQARERQAQRPRE